MKTICKNCNKNLLGNFCSNCGQSADTHDIDFKSIIHELQHSVFHIDKGLLYTTRQLFVRPGHTIREYIFGRRVKHFKPVAYIIVLSTIYTLLTSITNNTSYIESFLEGMMVSKVGTSKDRFNMFFESLLWMKNHYAYATLIFIPITSIASYLAFFKTKYNYFQHLILNTFIAGQKTVVLLVILPILYFINNKEVTDIAEVFTFLLGILLTFWAYYQFFNQIKPFRKIILTILAYIIATISFIALLILLVGISKELN
jgi:Protein of unknown function (DUF3667)